MHCAVEGITLMPLGLALHRLALMALFCTFEPLNVLVFVCVPECIFVRDVCDTVSLLRYVGLQTPYINCALSLSPPSTTQAKELHSAKPKGSQ